MPAVPIHISSRHQLFDLNLKEVWQYRHLVRMFTMRAFTVSYKQTILGPLWLFLNPLLSSVFQVVLFGNIAKLSTDGLPQLLFYFTGNTIWGYFSNTLTGNAETFSGNYYLFGKIYFPRLVMPLATILLAAMRFGIQMLFVLGLMGYYTCRGLLTPQWGLLPVVPVALLELGLLGMGTGLIFASLTVKYRDLRALLSFGLQLWMYATPVVYPLSAVPGRLQGLLRWNPATAPIELFRRALLGVGNMDLAMMAYSWAVVLAVAFLGLILFHKTERTFIDMI